jgi:hypothetical protein
MPKPGKSVLKRLFTTWSVKKQVMAIFVPINLLLWALIGASGIFFAYYARIETSARMQEMLDDYTEKY